MTISLKLRQRIEELLGLAAANPVYLPELLRVLAPLDVTCLGEVVSNVGAPPGTNISGVMYGGRFVLPCFTSPQALHAADLEDETHLVAPFTEFLAFAKPLGHPVVVNLDSPSEWTILPEQLVAIPAWASPAAPRGKKAQ